DARTIEHPVVNELKGVNWQSFDYICEKHDHFIVVYNEIVNRLIDRSRNEEVVYAVPRDPMVAVTRTQYQLERDSQVKILGGKSFLDDMFRAIKIDPNDGLTLLDGTNLEEKMLNIRTNTIITQVYDQMVASDVKVTLMERYPDEHIV